MTIEFYNEGLAPRGFCKLINQIIPRSRHRFKLIFNNRAEVSGVSGCIRYKNQDAAIWIKIYPTVIGYRSFIESEEIAGTRSFRSWQRLLCTVLHEFGHYFNYVPCLTGEYEHGSLYWCYIESRADQWAIKMMSTINDDRLGQPLGRLTGYLGVVEFQLEKQADESRKKHGFNLFTYYMMENVRARLAEGQYTLSQLSSMLSVSTYSIRKVAHALGINRYYKDMAGRKHLFFNHGEMSEIAYYLKESGKKRYTEEELKDRFRRKKLFMDIWKSRAWMRENMLYWFSKINLTLNK